MSAFLEKLAISLAGAGGLLLNLDPNDVGPDDCAGHLIVYAGDVHVAVNTNDDLPPLPAIVTKPLAGKIGPEARKILHAFGVSLVVAQMTLAFAGKSSAAQALKYVGQALTALASGSPLPAAPAALTTK
jgi:hypothetical protein